MVLTTAGATPAPPGWSPPICRYASPELLKEESYDSSIDMWGLGHILYTALTGEHPFENNLDMYSAVVNAEVCHSALAPCTRPHTAP